MNSNPTTLFTLYTCKIGSHAYNLVTPESDLDLRSVVLQTDLSYYFGLKNFDTIEYSDQEDHVGWSLRKFCSLAAKGNTQTLEMLFCPEDCLVQTNAVFEQHILLNRNKFITKQIYYAISGYAISEHRKALGETTRNLGERRKTDLQDYGYSSRNASHCIRLLYAGTIALTKGEFPVKLSGLIRDDCMSLKLGQMPLEEYKNYFTHWLAALDAARETSAVPTDFDYDWLNNTLIEVHKQLVL